MSKEIEDLINFINTLLNARLSDKHFINVANNETWLELSNIKLALLELKAIKEADPSEALEWLNEQLSYTDDCWTTYERGMLQTIKQALIKAEKEHKALEIIKKKDVNIWYLTVSTKVKNYKDYNSFLMNDKGKRQLTEEEFNLLKEVLE